MILTFLVYLPYSKHLHIATAAVNVFFGRTRRRGRLEPLRFDLPDDEIRFGVGTVGDLTWKEMVDSFSCTECGRCQDVCPAYATGKTLSPKLLIMGIRDQLLAEGPNLLAGGELTPIVGNGVPVEMIWDCVTCGACIHECPVSIEHVDHIVDLRRNLVMMESSFPQEAESMLRDVERIGNPWGKPQGDRAAWAEELGVRVVEEGEPAPEILYWVGCAAAYDERARTAAESTVKLLQKAGVDFAILGARESCTGDPARRMGNEYVFQSYAEQNVATLNDAGVTKIVASCPHCLNSLGNEYPDFGGQYEVMHHTQLLAELVRDGKLTPKAGEAEITYHDSCYLARHNDVRDEPRELVAAVGKPVEMARNRERTFCCGAGGAHMWMEERGTPINEERVREAVETGAETLAVACPFCTVMLDDGVRSLGKQLRVVDVVDAARRVDRELTCWSGSGTSISSVAIVERSLAFYAAVFGELGLEPPHLVRGERGETISYLRFPQAGSGSIGLRQALEEQPFELYAPGFHHLALAVERTADVELVLRERGRGRCRDPPRAAALAGLPPGLLRDVLPRPGRLPDRSGREPRRPPRHPRPSGPRTGLVETSPVSDPVVRGLHEDTAGRRRGTRLDKRGTHVPPYGRRWPPSPGHRRSTARRSCSSASSSRTGRSGSVSSPRAPAFRSRRPRASSARSSAAGSSSAPATVASRPGRCCSASRTATSGRASSSSRCLRCARSPTSPARRSTSVSRRRSAWSTSRRKTRATSWAARTGSVAASPTRRPRTARC